MIPATGYTVSIKGFEACDCDCDSNSYETASMSRKMRREKSRKVLVTWKLLDFEVDAWKV